MSTSHPPKLAQRILLRFLRDDLAEEVLGDLEERFQVASKNKSLVEAKLNYWYEVLNYVRPFAIRKSKSPYINQYAMFQNYFKIGWRNLLKHKGHSFINIGGLAVGMAVTLVIGLWIYDELSFNKYHRNFETIAKVYRKQRWRGEVMANTQHVTGLGTLLKTEYGTYFENVVMVRAGVEDRVIAFGNKKFTQSGYFMQPEGGEMFSLKMNYGVQNGLKDMNSILLSESLAKKLFGDVDPTNQVVSMDAKMELKVTGVYEDLPKNSEFSEATYFAPLDLYLNGWATLHDWDNYHMFIYAQIKPEVNFEKISASIKHAALPHLDAEHKDSQFELFLQPMAKWHLYSQFENGVSVTSERLRFVWFYGLIGVLVLLLASINFMNLSTARSEKRAKEVGIRKSVGSQRGQLVQQFLGESFLVAVISFFISILVAWLSLPWFNNIADKNMMMPWTNINFWLGSIGFTLITGLLAGSYPALYLSSFKPIKVLKGTFKVGQAAKLPRRLLVIVQFTVSICLVIGTIVVYQQIQFAKNRPVGYSRDGLIELCPKSPEYAGKYDALRNELQRTGVVEEMAEANYSITNTLGWNGGFAWQGQTFEPSFNTITVTHEYGKTIGWEFVAGRDFSREFPGDLRGVVINESALKILGLKNPVGEYLTWSPGGEDRGSFRILGVVKDMVKGSPFEPTDPSIIFLKENDQQWLYIRINPFISASEALPKIQSVFTSLIPSVPFDYKFANEAYDAKFRSEERVGKLAGIFSLLAILISCAGLFGLASFIAEQRTKEMSIRKVLGASVSNLWRLMSKEFVILVIVSCAIAIPLSSSFMEKWLQQYAYRTGIEWNVFVITCIGALVITLLTVSYQALKAAMVNPVNSLKSE
jgi:putative ABC transport system permease protein